MAGQIRDMGAAGSDEEHFTALFRQHYDAVLRYAQRRTGGPIAGDVTAEVFLTAWRRLADVPAEPLPWLIGTARRVLANQRRGRDRVDALRLRLRSEGPPPAVGVDEQVSVTATWYAAMQRLSDDDQEVLALLAWDGLTAREAAASLGCSEAAFVMRLHRARRRLSRHLHDVDPPAAVSGVRPPTTGSAMPAVGERTNP